MIKIQKLSFSDMFDRNNELVYLMQMEMQNIFSTKEKSIFRSKNEIFLTRRGNIEVKISYNNIHWYFNWLEYSALSHQLCKFREPLNSTIKFDHKMSHSFIPIGDRHRPFFGNIITCQI